MSDASLFELALQWESDEHFKILTHPSKILLWMADASGKMVFVSPSWTRFTGRSLADELDEGWLHCVADADVARVRNTFAHAAREGQAFRIKFRLQRHDGFVCWLAMEAMPQASPTSSASGYIGFCLDITPLEQGELDMNLADQRMIDLLQRTRLAAVALDLSGRILYHNKPLTTLLGLNETDLTYNKLFEICACSQCNDMRHQLYPNDIQAADFPMEFETCWITADVRTVIVAWHSITLRNFSGQIKGAILIGEDVTSKRATEEQLRLTHRVFDATDQAMVITDPQATIISVNHAFTRLTGYPANEVIGCNPRVLQSGRHSDEFYAAMWRNLVTEGHWHGDIWDRRKDGSIYPKYLSISSVRDEADCITHYCGMFYDISERKSIEEKLDRLAHYDALTGLPNRSFLHEHLDKAVSHALRAGTKVALLYIDLDHFKEVNDTEGHQGGDVLLVEVAQRLVGCVRAHDTVARIGGDEFAILLPDVHDMDSVARVAEKILDAFSTRFLIVDHEYPVTPSIGISIYPDDHHSLDVLLQNADQAMYRAKQDGRNGYRFYHQLFP